MVPLLPPLGTMIPAKQNKMKDVLLCETGARKSYCSCRLHRQGAGGEKGMEQQHSLQPHSLTFLLSLALICIALLVKENNNTGS